MDIFPFALLSLSIIQFISVFKNMIKDLYFQFFQDTTWSERRCLVSPEHDWEGWFRVDWDQPPDRPHHHCHRVHGQVWQWSGRGVCGKLYVGVFPTPFEQVGEIPQYWEQWNYGRQYKYLHRSQAGPEPCYSCLQDQISSLQSTSANHLYEDWSLRLCLRWWVQHFISSCNVFNFNKEFGSIFLTEDCHIASGHNTTTIIVLNFHDYCWMDESV